MANIKEWSLSSRLNQIRKENVRYVPGTHFYEDGDPRIKKVATIFGETYWIVGYDVGDFVQDQMWPVVISEDNDDVLSIHPDSIIKG